MNLLFLMACLDPASVAVRTPPPPVPPPLPNYRCTSDPFDGSEGVVRVWRGSLYGIEEQTRLQLLADDFVVSPFVDPTPPRELNLTFAQTFVEPLDVDNGMVAVMLQPWPGAPGIHTGLLVIGPDTVGLTCWRVEPHPVRYDPDTGTCERTDGTTGRLAFPVAMVRETARGACTRLSGDLTEGQNLGRAWQGHDLSGADLDDAFLTFGSLLDVDLAGARLSELRYADARIEGSADEWTEYPSQCSFTADMLSCSN